MGLALYREHQRRRYIVAHPPFILPSAQGQHWKDILRDDGKDISQKEIVFCIASHIIIIDKKSLSPWWPKTISEKKGVFLLCYIMWADPRSVIEMVASVTISGGYFPARSFHPIHFISLFLLPTLFTTISFTIICKQYSQWVKLVIDKITKREILSYLMKWTFDRVIFFTAPPPKSTEKLI